MQTRHLGIVGISFLSLVIGACSFGGTDVSTPSQNDISDQVEDTTEKTMTAMEFNDKLIALQETTLKPAEDFGVAVGEGIGSGEIDNVALADALEKVQQEFDTAYDEMDALTVPDYPKAQEFYDEMMNFMSIERDQVVDDYFQQIYDVMVDETKTIDVKSTEVQGLFDELSPIENDALTALQAAQQAFADANDFGLEQPSEQPVEQPAE